MFYIANCRSTVVLITVVMSRFVIYIKRELWNAFSMWVLNTSQNSILALEPKPESLPEYLLLCFPVQCYQFFKEAVANSTWLQPTIATR